MQNGMIILAHGSKMPETKRTLNRIVEKTQEKMGEVPVLGAYLQLCEPLFPEVVANLVEHGIHEIVVMPLFLFNGTHVIQDIPEMIGELMKKYPGLSMELTSHIGYDDRIVDIVLDRIARHQPLKEV